MSDPDGSWRGNHMAAGLPDDSMTVAEAAQPDETVEDRLRVAHDCWPLLQVVTGQRDAATLSYEDWARPLKLTGGKVALRCSHPRGAVAWYYRVTSDWMEGVDSDGIEREGPEAVRTLQYSIGDPDVAIEAVRIEDTPFAEDGNG